MPLDALFELGFPSASPSGLTLRHSVTRRPIMQKVRGRTFPLRGIVLPLLVDTRFQVLFHSPHRGAFHLSLTVLVHYRSSSSIQPWKMVLPDSRWVSRALRYSGATPETFRFRVQGCHLLWPAFADRFPSKTFCNSVPELGS
jgi:hypothetical protein